MAEVTNSQANSPRGDPPPAVEAQGPAVSGTTALGATPHPSTALVDRGWLEQQFGSAPNYISIADSGGFLGIVRVVDSGKNSLGIVFLSPSSWLKETPKGGTTVTIGVATPTEYSLWLRQRTRTKRVMFWSALLLTIGAGIIEVFWSVGKYWTVFTPGDNLAAASQLAKWVFVGLGVTGITALRDYRNIE